MSILVGCSAPAATPESESPIATSTPEPPAATPTPEPPEAIPPTAKPTPTLSPLEARVGEWSGATEFGSFSFVVSPNGKRVTVLDLSYRIGDLSTSSSFTPEGEGMPIDEDGSFNFSVSEPYLNFRGQFSQDGTSATGIWEMDIPFTDTTVSEEWAIER